MALNRGRTALYRLYAESGELLYVGTSSRPEGRLAQHEADKPWWPDVASKMEVWYENRAEAERAESHAVKAEKLRHNIRLRPGAKTGWVSARFSDEEIARLDAERGELGRADFLRGLAIAELKRWLAESGESWAPDDGAGEIARLEAEGGCLHPPRRILKGSCGACGTYVGA